MTPDDLRLVTADVAAIDPDDFASRFYDTLFELAPDVRSMFPDDLGVQRAKLMAELAALVTMATSMASGDLDRFVERAHRLGDRHVDYGATPGHYEVVGVALVATLAVAIDDWDERHHAAWRRLYALVSATMQESVTVR